MTAFALDAQHDIYLGTGGSLARLTGADCVVQSIRTRLLLYKGEWWLDLLAGTPWFTEIMVKPANVQAAEAKLKARIMGTTGVAELLSFAATFVASDRNFTVQFEVLTDYGPSGLVTVSV